MGDLSLATGIFADNSVPGEQTTVRNIRVREVGVLLKPRSGELTKDQSSIATERARVDVPWAYATAEFTIPDDTDQWSCGFMLRKAATEDYIALRITSSERWLISRATYSGGGWQTLGDGSSRYIDIAAPIRNYIEVFFYQDTAIFYANDNLLGVTDISDLPSVPDTGDVRLSYGFYRGDVFSTAQYHNFTVWGTRD